MKYIYIILTIISVSFYSCTERIDFELDEGDNNRLVVNGEFTDEMKIQTIKLTRSTQYYYTDAAPVELGATVTISDESDIYTLTDSNNDGVYETNIEVAGVPGNTYSLDIELSDGSNYTANGYMEPLGDIDTIKYEYTEEFDYNEMKTVFLYKMYIFFKDPSTMSNYGSFDLYINNKLDTDSLHERYLFNSEYYSVNFFEDTEMFRIANDSITKDMTPVKFKVKSISEDLYDYNNAVLLETIYRGSMFDGPPANVPTNISNGALGFFAVSAVKEAETEIVYQTNPE